MHVSLYTKIYYTYFSSMNILDSVKGNPSIFEHRVPKPVYVHFQSAESIVLRSLPRCKYFSKLLFQTCKSWLTYLACHTACTFISLLHFTSKHKSLKQRRSGKLEPQLSLSPWYQRFFNSLCLLVTKNPHVQFPLHVCWSYTLHVRNYLCLYFVYRSVSFESIFHYK